MSAVGCDAPRLSTHSRRDWRPVLSDEATLFLTCLWFVVACNGPLWVAMARAQIPIPVQSAMAVAILALHALVLGVFVWGRATKPALCILFVVTAIANDSMLKFGVIFDVDMARSVLLTDPDEVHEMLATLFTARLFWLGIVPAVLVLATRQQRLGLRRSLRNRALFLVAMAVLTVAALAPVSQAVFALMRSDPSLRYQITPGNVIVSTARALKQDEAAPDGPRLPVASDAYRRPNTRARLPRVVVVVVGETVRADHWGLNGYARQTTPELAKRGDIINFADVTACGTSTAVSLPCMFSVFGREQYDRGAIISHESVLQVLARLGIKVLWRDNQAGCKGACEGIDFQTMPVQDAPGLCAEGRCLDETLLQGLAEHIKATAGDQLIVLHQLGNHGPNYFERYPAAFKRFQPTCDSTELERCSRDEIINAYDNAVLYTDSVLARLIALLSADHRHETAVLYVSDHGESLGEYGIYLHGAPWSIAPRAQLKVPMLLWLSPQTVDDLAVNHACLLASAADPRSHDDLFHTLLGLFDVSTQAYRPDHDLLASCHNAGLASQ
ncbi:MAG TPA: phosphoethanolamine--lipid A transferase [Chiayiivirga sp.]|nr:phosphoethanolamine--lipid A transferase [Chiayiivirga sp.]